MPATQGIHQGGRRPVEQNSNEQTSVTKSSLGLVVCGVFFFLNEVFRHVLFACPFASTLILEN